VRVGIDLGTTRTVVAAVDGGRHPVLVHETAEGSADWIPGCCAVIDGTLKFGWEAQEALSRAEFVVRSVKRAVSSLAPDEPVPGLPGEPSALEVLTAYAAHVLDSAARCSFGERPTEVMLAVPASASSQQRWITMEAFRRAGADVLGLLNEPTAGAIEYARRHLGADPRRSPKRYVVVYDLGGGTFDASAVSLRGRRFELLVSEGIARLGGEDLDDVILDLALERAGVGRSHPQSTLVALLDRARAAKEAMGPSSRNVLVDLQAVDPSLPTVVLEASVVLEACAPLVRRTLDVLAGLFTRLPQYGIDPENARELGGVYVVGGGASFVGVARALRAAYGRKVIQAAAPHASTAVGLSVAADEGSGIYVRESFTRHFGVWRERDAGREKVFDPIFVNGLGADAVREVRRRYTPRHTVGHLRFVECTAIAADGTPCGDLTPTREIVFPYDPALCGDADLAPTRVADLVRADPSVRDEQIEEIYRYGESGAVTLTITNLTRGYARTYELGKLR
jgi:molecular chaperone DnaK (HSP70)